jgi:hypothetical protein
MNVGSGRQSAVTSHQASISPRKKSLGSFWDASAFFQTVTPGASLLNIRQICLTILNVPVPFGANRENCFGRFFDAFESRPLPTFNYDSLPETILFHRGLWFPHDGYGLLRAVAHLPPGSGEFANSESVSVVLHLHGNLCIPTSEFRATRTEAQGMTWTTEREEPRYSFDPGPIGPTFAPFQCEAGSDDIEGSDHRADTG